MTLYYSQSNGGFYDDQIHSRLPEDAVAISPEQHTALLAGQSNGQVIMPNKAGQPVLAEQPPCPSSTWDGEQWNISPECAAQLKAEQQDEMWERIKAKRYDNLRHGVFVKSVGKWFYTNDESRTQYILLRTMKTLPPNLKWKTMENDFVLMTRELLDDPPYWDCETMYGKGIFAKDDFERLAEQLRHIKGRFLLSINDVPAIREIFTGF